MEDLDKPQSPLNDWRIMLVNADNPVPKGYNIKLATIEGAVLFDERAADDLKNLLKDCRRETNYQLRVRTGYRSRAIQDGIYRAKIRNHMDRGKSRAEAERRRGTTSLFREPVNTRLAWQWISILWRSTLRIPQPINGWKKMPINMDLF